MKIRIVQLSFWAFIFIFISCGESLKQNKQGYILNMENVLLQYKTEKLSFLSDSLDCVILETTDSCLLAGKSYLFYADEQDLFIRSKDIIYRFDFNGHFLNSIGKKGNGPKEYTMLYSVSVDPIQECLLFYIGQKRVQYWDYDGTFRKEIILKDEGEITNARLLDSNTVVAENRLYLERGVQIAIHIFDSEGFLKRKIPINEDTELVNIHMKTQPILYNRNGMIKYKDINDKVLYAVSNTIDSIQWIFDFGKYMPSRELLEDVSKKEILLKEYIQLVDIQECKSDFYLLIIYAHKLRGIVLDKETGFVKYNELIDMPQRGGGIQNNFIDNTCFWPTFIDDNNIAYALLSKDRITTKGEKDILSFSPKICTLMREDDNPVLIKVHLK